MRTDREVLELAAKAAGMTGMEYTDHFVGDYYDIRNGEFGMRDNSELSIWNSLTDDGDALRLAVSVPSVNLHWVVMEAWQTYDNEEDRRAYVRRAITIAAAEMASALP